jgi:hypothetical protein
MTEQWQPIPQWPGYEASNLGRIRSLDRTATCGRPLHGRIISQWVLHGKQYRMVTLSYDGTYRNALVHRLVLSAFRGLPVAGQQCRHLDGNPTNNHLDNLAWGSGRENTVDQVRHGTHRNAAKTHCLRGHAYTPDNTYLSRGGVRVCRACRVVRGEIKGKYTRTRR